MLNGRPENHLKSCARITMAPICYPSSANGERTVGITLKQEGLLKPPWLVGEGHKLLVDRRTGSTSNKRDADHGVGAGQRKLCPVSPAPDTRPHLHATDPYPIDVTVELKKVL
jgi:hypothetical protein